MDILRCLAFFSIRFDVKVVVIPILVLQLIHRGQSALSYNIVYDALTILPWDL